MDTKNLSNLIGMIYSAADEDDLWRSVVDVIRCDLKADSALLFTSASTQNDHELLEQINMDDWSFQAYSDYYKNHDLWYAGSKIRKLDREGIVVLGEELVDEVQFQKSEWFNDFLKPSRQHRLLGANVESSHFEAGPTFLNFYKGTNNGHFNSDDRSALELLLPHIQRAFRLRRQRIIDKRAQILLNSALDSLQTPCLAVGYDLDLLLSNRASIEIIEEKDGIYVSSDGKLRCNSASSSAHLLNLVRSILGKSPDIKPPGDYGILIHRPSGSGTILLQAGLMRNLDFGEESVVITMTLFPAGNRQTSIAMLRQFGLSTAEARLAAIVGSGSSPAEAAEELNISEGNARTTLKNVFSKLGINRQGELAVFVTKVRQGQISL